MWIATIAIIYFGVFRIVLVNQIGTETSWGALRFFDLDKELSLPAWYSSILLWSAAIVLVINASLAPRLTEEPFSTGGRWQLSSSTFRSTK